MILCRQLYRPKSAKLKAEMEKGKKDADESRG